MGSLRHRDDVRHHDRPGRHDDRRADHRDADDVVGRRKALIGSVTAFSVLTLACAFAPNEVVFGVLRFLAGIGLGGCLPTAIAIVNEFTRSGRSGRATTTIMTGYHVGAVPTAALAIAVIPTLGWEWMFVPRLAAGAGPRPADGAVPAGVGVLPRRARPPGRGRGRRPPLRPRTRVARRPGRRPGGGGRRRDGEDAVHPGVRPQHRGHRGDHVHGPAAGLRPEQLAADDHARGRVRPGRLARLPPRAQRRRSSDSWSPARSPTGSVPARRASSGSPAPPSSSRCCRSSCPSPAST